MPAPQDFEVTIEPGADRVVVRIQGDLDMSNAEALGEALTKAGGAGDAVVADLTGVTFMDSSALSALVASARALSAADTRLTLGDRSSVVERVLEITGLADGSEDLDVQPAPEGRAPNG
jgi:anti-sigma B factor antagonist